MNGWTEPQGQRDARTMRRAFGKDAQNLYLRQTSEADADTLHDCIFAAELADSAEVDDHPADLAEVGESPTALPHDPSTERTAVVEYEDLGTRCIISGGEVVEWGDWWKTGNKEEDIPF